MTKEAFEHAVRAAGAVLGAVEILVIGSQALRSVEVDVAALGGAPDGCLADLIDGSIGEASMFHETFGYYALGVVVSTAVPPLGWRRRLIRYETPGTAGVVAWCLETHDLWVSKAIAGRPKDLEFCRALVEGGMVRPATLRSRLTKVESLDERIRGAVAARIPS